MRGGKEWRGAMDEVSPESLKRLFERASALPAQEQRAFLEDASADDPEAQDELASLRVPSSGVRALVPGALRV